MASRQASMSPPVERSITVSPPQRSAQRSFSTSSSVPLEIGEAPMFAFTLVRLARPIAIGSSWKPACTRLAGMTMRPAATSSRTCSGVRCGSRLGHAPHLRRDGSEPRVLELGHGLEARRRDAEAGRLVAHPAPAAGSPRPSCPTAAACPACPARLKLSGPPTSGALAKLPGVVPAPVEDGSFPRGWKSMGGHARRSSGWQSVGRSGRRTPGGALRFGRPSLPYARANEIRFQGCHLRTLPGGPSAACRPPPGSDGEASAPGGIGRGAAASLRRHVGPRRPPAARARAPRAGVRPQPGPVHGRPGRAARPGAHLPRRRRAGAAGPERRPASRPPCRRLPGRPVRAAPPLRGCRRPRRQPPGRRARGCRPVPDRCAWARPAPRPPFVASRGRASRSSSRSGPSTG